ncbi:Na+/H+ antiporter subunit E [Rubritalea tangerina]|uniref:Na+/H+ antiporter subunit E n=1 Tax=Rubritalea tangerina TaxID=430798 RepID=A0ABW4Z675_9BACT
MKVFKFIGFGFFYLKEVVVSNLRVAADIVTPQHLMKPEILEVDVSGLTPKQLFVASNLITMTPGTLSMDVVDDRLFIHCMYCVDKQEAEENLVENYVNRVRDVF